MNKHLIPITFFSGPMRSGKSTRLLAELQRSSYRKDIKTVFYRPARDTRDFIARSMANDIGNIEVRTIQRAKDILDFDVDVVGIDELHFLEEEIVAYILQLYTQGKEIYVAGLNLDAFGTPWQSSQALLCSPEVNIVRCFGSCQLCSSRWATRTYSPTQVNNQVGDDIYKTVCFMCWEQQYDKQETLV